MRKTILVALAVMAGATLNVASAAKKNKKQAKQTVLAPVELKNGSDTLSYVAGMSLTNGLVPYLEQSMDVDTAYMADFVRGLQELIQAGEDPKMKAYAAGMTIAGQLKSRMLPNMSKEFTDTPDSVVSTIVFRAFTDALAGDTTVFKMDDAEKVFKAKRESNSAAREEKLYGDNRRAGEQFLADNAKKDSVITLPSGLQYKVLVKGEGEVPQKSDKVEVNYEGRLIDGTVFDSSAKHGSKPLSFRADQVIKGWTEALTMMPVGSKWELYIPQELAYGSRDTGKIKPFSALVFTVELVGIEGKTPADKPVEAKDDVKTTAKKKK